MLNTILYLNKQSKAFIIIFGFVIALFLGFVDYITGPEIGFSIFYLLPISMVTWLAGITWGIVISFACSILWFSADILGGHIYSNPAIGYWAATMRLGYFLIICYLISTVNRILREERHMASTDYLTGIANSRSFYNMANTELERMRRYKHPFTIAYFDLDNFKMINDNFGHTIGDNVLREIAGIIKNNIRLSDLTGRLGGDEFAILLPETDYESAKIVMNKVHKILLDTMKKNRWGTTFSIGVITYLKAPEDVDTMITEVDNLMYSVKNSGKNMLKHELSDK